MSGSAEVDIKRQQLLLSIRDAAHALRTCANVADDFANYLGNLLPVPSAYVPAHDITFTQHVATGRKPGRGKKNKNGEELGASDGENGQGRKRKRGPPKAPKDPNAPKRPPSAYLLFQNATRKTISGDNPDLPYQQLLTLISQSWNQLTDDEKKPYFDATAIAKQDFEAKRTAYEAQKAGAAAAAAATAATEGDSSEEAEEVVAASLKQSDGGEDDEDEEDSSDESSEEEQVQQPIKKKARKDVAVAPPRPPPATETKKPKKEKEKEKKEPEVKKGRKSKA